MSLELFTVQTYGVLHTHCSHTKLMPTSSVTSAGQQQQQQQDTDKFPTPAWTRNFFPHRSCGPPSTNSFAYSQSELHDMNMNDLRLRNKTAHARGLVILLPRCSEDTRKMHILELSLSIYVQNNGDLRVILYCALIQNQKPFSLILTITLVRGKLTLL